MNNWISYNLLHALGWTLVHSLWEILALAAIAAVLMTLSRRPFLRYGISVCALVLMLAAPVATLFVLMRADAPLAVSEAASLSAPAMPALKDVAPTVALGSNNGAALEGFALVPAAPMGFSLQRLLPWLVCAWLCGVTLFSLRFAGGFLLLEHRRRTQSFPPDARILTLCGQVQQQLGLTRAIRYLECGWLEAPAAMGWLSPVILLPVTALTGLDEAQLRAVIAHELAHIRRWDFQVNLFQIFAETLLFYHPALWWLNKRIRVERELCCDEIAVAVTGNRLVYATALASMAEWKSVSTLAMAANRGPMARRILTVLGQNPLGLRQRVIGLTGGVVFLIAALAAANTLFGIAYPAHASESPKPVIASAPIASPKQAAPVAPPAPEAANSVTASASPAQPAAAATPQAPSVTPAQTTDASPQASSQGAPASQAVVALNTPPASPAAESAAPADQSTAEKRAALFTAASKAFSQAGCGLNLAMGFLTRVYPDPARFAVDLQLDNVLQEPAATRARIDRAGTLIAAFSKGDEPSNLNSLVGHDVVVGGMGVGRFALLPGQIQLLSTALENSDRFCHASVRHTDVPFAKEFGLQTRVQPDVRPVSLETSGSELQTAEPLSATKPALACIFGLAPDGCKTMFVAGASKIVARTARHATLPNFSAKLVWHNSAGDDVWDVKGGMSPLERATVVIGQPDTNGKVRRLQILQGAPDHQCDDVLPRIGDRVNSGCQVWFTSL